MNYGHSVSSILMKFNLDLDLFIYKNSIDYSKSIEYFSEWKYNVLVNLNLERYKHLDNNNYIYVKQQKKHKQNLLNKFVITVVDISPNSYAIIIF